jgi:hypothetical protein
MSQQQERLQPNMEQSFNIAYFVANCGCWCVAPFIRSGIGKRAGGLDLGVAAFVILWIAGSQHSQAMMNYFGWWVVMVFYRRFTRGKGVITQYQGRPFTTMWLVRDEIFARTLESIGVWAFGVWLMPHSMVMGKFFFFVGLLMGVKCYVERLYMSRFDEAMEDEILIMRERMERVNRGR